MYKFIKGYSYTRCGYWLRLFKWDKVRIYRLPFCLQGIVTGFYSALFNVIFAAPDKDGRVYFGTICHELYHAYQRDCFGFCKYMFMKCFKRDLLQQRAKQVQMQAVQWACTQDRKEFQKWEI